MSKGKAFCGEGGQIYPKLIVIAYNFVASCSSPQNAKKLGLWHPKWGNVFGLPHMFETAYMKSRSVKSYVCEHKNYAVADPEDAVKNVFRGVTL